MRRLVPLLSAAAIVGCGSSNSSSSRPARARRARVGASTSSTSSSASASTSADAKVVALVPTAIKSKGTLTVAADASYAPNEFIASDGHTVIGMDADLSKALAAAHGAEDQGRQRDVRQHHPRPRRGQVRRRRVVVHRHQGAREDRRLRRLLQRRGVVLHQGLGRDDRSTASPTSAATRSRSRRARPSRPTPRRRASKCKKAGKPGGHGARVRRPERRQPGALERPGAARLRRLARRRVPGQEVKRPVQARRPVVRQRAVRPGGVRRAAASTSRCWPRSRC